MSGHVTKKIAPLVERNFAGGASFFPFFLFYGKEEKRKKRKGAFAFQQLGFLFFS
jgi:hypothetical protein